MVNHEPLNWHATYIAGIPVQFSMDQQLSPQTHAVDVITIGESMALFAAEEPGPLREVRRFGRYLAGAESNVAIGLKRLGLSTAWVSRLGSDILDAVQFASAMDYMRANQRSVSFDPNLRPSLWPTQEQMVKSINRLATSADLVLPGLVEGRLLTGHHTPQDIAAFYLDQGVRAVVIKLGPDGAYFRTSDSSGHVAAAPVEHIVDTVGAGDGFAAGVISARLEDQDWHQALARGNWVAARTLQTVGDMDGLPLRRELPCSDCH